MSKNKTQLIDYSCSRYGIKIKGLDRQYVSVGCRMESVGEWHGKKPRLIITWAATNFKLLNGSSGPFTAYLRKTSKLEFKVIDQYKKIRSVSISARLPERLHRLKTAWGIGPYLFETEVDTTDDNGTTTTSSSGKNDLSEGASLKFFNAAVYNNSIFNNFGLYFSYLLAEAMDGNFKLVPLLGAQTLSIKHGTDEIDHRVIIPQGFEFIFLNPFGIEGATPNFVDCRLQTRDRELRPTDFFQSLG